MKTALREKDKRWLFGWALACLCLLFWDIAFLNRPALKQVLTGAWNTLCIALLVSLITLLFAWGAAISLHFLKNRAGSLLLTFLLNLVRSVPQIIGVLFGYVFVASLINRGALGKGPLAFLVMAAWMSLFIFLELTDLMRERIEHFQKLDFYNAMRVCGVPESRIVNFNILWKNSRIHIFNKLISIFGMAVFLQCSVDFIISVGLSTDVQSVTLPTTLGSLLAKIDSKQDILAVGFTLTHPGYANHLFFGHLQGLTVAFLIVFSLLCIYHIANGFAERHRL